MSEIQRPPQAHPNRHTSEYPRASGYPEVTGALLSDLVTELDTAICNCDTTRTDQGVMGVASLGLLIRVSDVLAEFELRFAAAAAKKADAALAAAQESRAAADPATPEDGGLVYTARLTYQFPEESPIPLDYGEVDITAEQMQVLLRAPGQAMFDVLTHDSTVTQAVDWANQLERTETGDTREGEDWVLTYRMRPSDRQVKPGEAPEAEEDEDEDARARFNELHRRYCQVEDD